MTPTGFPHSEISGSTLVCNSPELIAANHVLHRLLAPRHPPRALSSLTINICRRFTTRRPAGWRPRFQTRTMYSSRGAMNDLLRATFIVDSSPVTKSCPALARHAFASRSLFCCQGSVRSREPKILQLPSARVKKPWSTWDSNPRPSACKADALPTELVPQRDIQFSAWWAWLDLN